MKMKKTQSLKLMLLGLMSLVSTSALAAVGDIFEWGANDGAGGVLYYEEITGGAKVIGVKTVGENGLIVIPTECKNNWYSPYAALNVIALDDNWFAKTQIVLKKMAADGTVLVERPMGQSASLNDYDGLLTLQIDAAKLTKIGTDALQPLNKKIKKFVVSATAGLTAIPEYAFINGTKTTPTDDEAIADKQAEIAELLALINGTKRVIKGGMYGDKPVFKGSTADFNPAITGRWANEYLFLGDEVVGNDNDGNESPLYEVFLVDSKGKVSKTNVVARRKNSNQAQLVNYSLYGNDAVLATQEPETTDYGYYNLTRDKQEAETALQTAQTNLMAYEQGTEKTLTEARDEAKAAYDAAVAMRQKMRDDAVATAWNRATSNVWAAIAAGDNTRLTNVTPAFELDTYNTIYAALVAVNWPVNADGKFVLTNNDILNLNDEVVTKYNNYQTKEQALQTSLTTFKKPLQDALTKAENDFNAAKKALDDAVAALNAAQGELDTLNEGVAFYTVDGENKTLEEVILIGKGDLTDFGKSAFEKCVEAKFIQTNGANLPASTVNIAPRAFFNASIAPIFGKLVNLETIGNEAFANSKAATANFQNSPNLYAFGEHVFDNCKLQNLLLKGTAIEADPEGPKYPAALAQYLYQETPKFIDDCGYFYNYDVKNDEDLAALKAAWKAKFGKDMTLEDIENLDGKEAKVNTTLTKVTLPENIKAIPNEAFMNDIALATLDVIPAGVAYIGDMAFFRTQIKEFDLSLLVNLYYVGDQAFAGNKEVTKVILPQGDNTKLQALGDEVFECNGKLAEVVLGPEITCLPDGTFAGNNSIKVLDLSNTKIEVLHNLFGTGEVNDDNTYGETFKKEFVNTSLKKIILPKQVLDEDNYKEIIPGLKVIMPGALAFMQGLGQADDDNNKWGVEIPSTVFFMGDMAFYNCNHLETVTAMDSRLTTIGRNTFRGCDALTDFYFVTLQMANNQDVDLDDAIENYLGSSAEWNSCGLEDLTRYPTMRSFLDDHAFFFNSSTTLHMTKESIENLRSSFTEHGFTNFREYVPELTMNVDGTAPYFNKDYATWISMYEADVYTCYQDVVEDPALGASVVKIYMIKAKHNQGYYKIPAATTYSTEGQGGQGSGLIPIDGNFWRPVNGVYQFPGYNDTFMDWYVEGPAGTDYTEGPNNGYTPSAAVIIRENDRKGAKDGKVPYERHSADELIHQSTLDPANQLMITRKPIGPLSSSSKLMQFTHPKSGGNNDWIRMTEGTIKAGRLVLPLSAGASNGNSGFIEDNYVPSRIEVIWVDDDMTGIEDVKSYIKSLNDSEAIYNLQGVKVTAPVKGQLYIQGGKKFIQK